MKKIKRMMAIAIAIILTLGVSNFVFAADPSTPTTEASITIKSTATTGTDTTAYEAYEILKASIGTGGAVSYYLPASATTLKTALDAVAITKNGSSVDVFTFTPSTDGSRFNATVNSVIDSDDGEALANALNTDAIKNASNTELHTKYSFAQTQAGGSATSGEVDPGYYLVTSSLGTKLVLQTLSNVAINTKNEYITDTKTASLTHMNVGDKVTYTITIHVPSTAQVNDVITVHDTLDAHLAILNSSEAIAANEEAYHITASYNNGTNDVSVTLSDGTKKANTETFAKSFTVVDGMINKDVVLTYKAELLSTAANDEGYVNESFANDDSFETIPSKVRVWTFDFNLDKTFAGVAAADAGNFSATFQLRTTANDAATAISFNSVTGGYKKVDSDDQGGSTSITVTGGDAINLCGLNAGVYYLVETATADGYNLLTDPIEVKITDTTPTTAVTDTSITPSHTVEYKLTPTANDYTSASDKTVPVENNKGAVLPSTGGSGTTMIYIIGVILLAGAGILLVTRRRMKAE